MGPMTKVVAPVLDLLTHKLLKKLLAFQISYEHFPDMRFVPEYSK